MEFWRSPVYTHPGIRRVALIASVQGQFPLRDFNAGVRTIVSSAPRVYEGQCEEVGRLGIRVTEGVREAGAEMHNEYDWEG